MPRIEESGYPLRGGGQVLPAGNRCRRSDGHAVPAEEQKAARSGGG